MKHFLSLLRRLTSRHLKVSDGRTMRDLSPYSDYGDLYDLTPSEVESFFSPSSAKEVF